MIEGFVVLLACQLAGETLARLLALPVPGPVLGMALLLAGLMWRGRRRPEVPQIVGDAADGLLRNLSLLFVPAAVGIVQYFGLVADHALAIAAAIAVSTVATLAVTAIVFERLARR